MRQILVFNALKPNETQHSDNFWRSYSTSGIYAMTVLYLFDTKKKTTWSSKFGLCFPPLLAPLSLLSSNIFFPPRPPLFFLFLSFNFEASAEDSVNGLTSQLSLKQCGLGPLLCSVYRGESTAPKGQPGPLALRRTRQVAPHFFTLV